MSRLGVGDAKEKNEGKGSHGQDLASTLSKIPAAEGFEEVTGSITLSKVKALPPNPARSLVLGLWPPLKPSFQTPKGMET